ncbi:hypothetical protein M404DRAFT_32812 [Pisolithus tinctorius Marx 270]|uniref:Uncharacterized protein n=1 Tax=Pisolithus tinctorius Marx 270 TaxID=870435 RepID=A0A0C3JGZ7_PISTI|nr:hypothetical protein M404DRAFT_32812 [Pisolithus tinctorius Marx 270]
MAQAGFRGMGQVRGVFWEPETEEATTRRARDRSRRLPDGSTGRDRAKPSLGVTRPAGQGFPEIVKAEADVSEGRSCTLELGEGKLKAGNNQGNMEAERVQRGPEMTKRQARGVPVCC